LVDLSRVRHQYPCRTGSKRFGIARLRKHPQIEGGKLEVGYFDLRLRYQSIPEQFNQDGGADPLAYHVDCCEKLVLDKLSRYESRIQREYSRCLKDLQTLQAARKKEIVETNPKSKVNPPKQRPSSDSDTPEDPAPDAPTPDPADPDV